MAEIFTSANVSITHEPYVGGVKSSIANLELRVTSVGVKLTVEQAATEIVKLLGDDKAFEPSWKEARSLLAEIRRQLLAAQTH